MAGKFITLEGGEGSGKSTQIKLLKESFAEARIPAVFTREPGGTEVAEKIRNILVTGDEGGLLPITELMLNFAARAEHLEKFIKPNLQKGNFVISDRFFDSSFAYQGYAHSLGRQEVSAIKNISIGNFQPDMTFILDIETKQGLQRTKKRSSNEDRYEKMHINFHEKVRAGFLKIARENPSRCHIINAAEPVEMVYSKIVKIINSELNIKLK